MSDKAISRRLRQADQLREISLSLMKIKKDSNEKAKKDKPIVKKVNAEN